MKLSLAELRRAAAIVHRAMDPTPQRTWPLLDARCGARVWVKHENHAPTGAFKVRGGLVHVDALLREPEPPRGVIAATRGNHGQSVAFACARAGLQVTIVVPRGNSPDKNDAMRALGAELVEHGDDFSESLEFAQARARERGLRFFPSFHPDLVAGVASYALELFEAAGPLDTVYVPIGLGSGICGVMAARDALGLATEVVGVVAARAPAYALSFERGAPVAADRSDTFADGVAVRVPEPAAVEQIGRGAARIVALDEDEIAEAARVLFDTTHNVAEGAGAAALGALLREPESARDRDVAVILSGGNIDRAAFHEILGGRTPRPYFTRST